MRKVTAMIVRILTNVYLNNTVFIKIFFKSVLTVVNFTNTSENCSRWSYIEFLKLNLFQQIRNQWP